jgi:uncharacterized protein involved in outer membrane biogenesis
MQNLAQAILPRASAIARTPRVRRIGWWILGIVVAIGIIGFLIVPPIAKPYLAEALSKQLKREVTIESLRVNPFALSATVRGFVMKDRPGPEPALTFDELYVNLSLGSIFRRAPVVEAVRLVKPHLRIVRNDDRTYNFQDLIDEAAAKPKEPDAPPPRFAVFNIELVDGRVDFDDRPVKHQHALSDIQLGLPFVSSLPVHHDVNVEPKFTAKLDDTPLELLAKSKPFKESQDSSVNLEIEGLDLLRYLDYSPVEIPVKIRSAKLDTDLDVTFAQPKGAAPTIVIAGAAALREIDLTQPNGEPILKLARLATELRVVEPLANRFDVERVVIESPEVRIHRLKGGEVYWLRLFEQRKGGAPKAAKPDAKPLAFRVGEIALTGGKIEAIDERASRPVRRNWDEVRATVRNLSNEKDAAAEVEVFLHDTRAETVSVAARLGLQPVKAEGILKVDGVSLPQSVSPYFEPFVALEATDGKVGAATKFLYTTSGNAPNVVLSDLEAKLTSLVLRQQWNKQELLRLAELTTRGVGFELQSQTVTIGELASHGARLSVRRERDGRLNVQKLLPEHGGAREATPAPQEPAKKAAGDAKPWSFALKKLAIDRYGILVEDQLAGPAATARVESLAVTGANLSNAKGSRGNIGARFKVNKTGSFAANGQLGLNPVSTRLQVDARSLGLLPLQPYFEQYVNAVVSSGDLSVKGAVALDLPEGRKPTGRFRGDVTLANFASVTKAANNEDLLRWKSLFVGGIDAVIEPQKAEVKEIALSDFYARLIVNADGTFNLQGLVKRPGDPAATATPPEPKPAAPPVAAAKPATKQAEAPAAQPKLSERVAGSGQPLPVSVGKVTLQGGNVNFSDYFVKPNYSANLTDLGGSVTEMTPEKPGDVEVHAKIDQSAPVEILGRVNPLSRDLFLDIKASAKDIELPPLSPYSVKYAGYGIERGKLSVNVKYFLEHRKLAAENNIYLDQLTFGEKVDSPTATKLPVLLAVALLQDRNGVIDVNLPISGTLDDPKFSVGGIIIQVIVNLVTKAVTAPFTLLAAAFGGAGAGGAGGDDLAYVEFAPGSAALDGTDEKKLTTLAKALGDRPGLKLDIAGRVDPATDREGLKKTALERQVKAAKLKDYAQGGTAAGSLDDVKLEAAEYTKYLTAAYRAADFPKPRNAIGLVKELTVPEMEQLMLANASASEEDLRQLANRRAQVTKDWLVQKGGVPAERVFLVAPKLNSEGIKDKGKPERADFSLK